MSKIYTLSSTRKIAKTIQQSNKKLVMVGGCFDLIHVGHIYFLTQAKKMGELLLVLLESDETVKKIKGENRPINTQKNRAKILAALEAVDYVCMLPPFHTNKEYDTLVLQVKPAIIATTKGDLFQEHKKRQATFIGAKVRTIKKVADYSSSNLAKSISKEFYL